MGRPKADLDWGATSFAGQVSAVLADVADGPVVVVRAQGQLLPELPSGVETAEDARPARGPLEGIAAGLHTVGGRADTAFVSAVDVPFLAPAFVRAVVGALPADEDAAVPRIADRTHPLSAVYRVDVLRVVEGLLARDVLSARSLLDELRVRWLGQAELLVDPALAAADPTLDSLVNVNTPAEYRAALRRRQESASRSGLV